MDETYQSYYDASLRVPEPIRQRLGVMVSEAYKEQYRNLFPDDPSFKGMDAYYAGDFERFAKETGRRISPQEEEWFTRSRDTSIRLVSMKPVVKSSLEDVSQITKGYLSENQVTNDALIKGVEQITRASTYRDLSNVLVQSHMEGIIKVVTKDVLDKNISDPTQIKIMLGSTTEGVANALPRYNPKVGRLTKFLIEVGARGGLTSAGRAEDIETGNTMGMPFDDPTGRLGTTSDTEEHWGGDNTPIFDKKGGVVFPGIFTKTGRLGGKGFVTLRLESHQTFDAHMDLDGEVTRTPTNRPLYVPPEEKVRLNMLFDKPNSQFNKKFGGHLRAWNDRQWPTLEDKDIMKVLHGTEPQVSDSRVDFTLPTKKEEEFLNMRRGILEMPSQIGTGLYRNTAKGNLLTKSDVAGTRIAELNLGNPLLSSIEGNKEVYLSQGQLLALTGLATPEDYRDNDLLNYAPQSVRDEYGVRYSKYSFAEDNLKLLKRRADYLVRQYAKIGPFGGAELEDNPDLLRNEAETRNMEVDKLKAPRLDAYGNLVNELGGGVSLGRPDPEASVKPVFERVTLSGERALIANALIGDYTRRRPVTKSQKGIFGLLEHPSLNNGFWFTQSEIDKRIADLGDRTGEQRHLKLISLLPKKAQRWLRDNPEAATQKVTVNILEGWDLAHDTDAAKPWEMIELMAYPRSEIEAALEKYNNMRITKRGAPERAFSETLTPREQEIINIYNGGIGNPEAKATSDAARLQGLDREVADAVKLLNATAELDPLQADLANRIGSRASTRNYVRKFYASASIAISKREKAIYNRGDAVAKSMAGKEKVAWDMVASGEAEDIHHAYALLKQRAEMPQTSSVVPQMPQDDRFIDEIGNNVLPQQPEDFIIPDERMEEEPEAFGDTLPQSNINYTQRALDAKKLIQEFFPEYESEWMLGDKSKEADFLKFKKEHLDFASAWDDLMTEHHGSKHIKIDNPSDPRYYGGRRGDANNPSVYKQWLDQAKPRTTGDYVAVDSSGKTYRYGTQFEIQKFIKDNPGIRMLKTEEYKARVATGRYYKPKPGKAVLYGMDVPGRIASYNEVFPDTTKRLGVSQRSGYSYVRNPIGGRYLPEEDFLHKYKDPHSRVRNIIQTFEGAALHETGHQVWWSMEEADKRIGERFTALFAAQREAGSHITKLLEEQGFEATDKEEFAQAYASARLFGVENLRKAGYETYARFFEDNETHLSIAESYAPPVIDYRDPENPRAFRVRDTQTVQEANADDVIEWMDSTVDESGNVVPLSKIPPQSARAKQQIPKTPTADEWATMSEEDKATYRAAVAPNVAKGIERENAKRAQEYQKAIDAVRNGTATDRQKAIAELATTAELGKKADVPGLVKGRDPVREALDSSRPVFKQATPIAAPSTPVAARATQFTDKDRDASRAFLQNYPGAGQVERDLRAHGEVVIRAKYRGLVSTALESVKNTTDSGGQYFSDSNILPEYAGGGKRYTSHDDPSDPQKVSYAYARGDVNTGEMKDTLSKEQVGQSIAVAKASVTEAYNAGGLPSNPKEFLGSLVQRVSKSLGQHFDEAMKEAGGSLDKRATVQNLEDLTKKVAKSIIGNVAEGIDATIGSGAATQGYEPMAYQTLPVNKEASLQKLMTLEPRVKEAVDNAGSIHSALTKGGIVVHGNKASYNIGGSGYDMGGFGFTDDGDGTGNGRPSRGGMWAGKLGGALYGMYTAKRFWGWTMGSMDTEMKAYGQQEQAVSSWATPQIDAAVGAPGYNVRGSLIDNYFARGAQEQFGGFQSIKYAMTGDGGGNARLWAGLRAAGAGVGAGFAALQSAQMIGMFAPAFGQTALGTAAMVGGTAAAPIAVGIGATIAAGTIGMEVYNRNFKPEEKKPIGWGTIPEAIQATWYQKQAAASAMEFGTEEERVAASEQYMKGLAGEKERGGIISQITAPGTGDYAYASEASIDKYLNPRQALIAKTSPDIDQQFSKAMELSENMEIITGEKATEISPSAMVLGRSLSGGLTNDLAIQTAKAARSGGYSTPSFIQEGLSTAQQLGIGVGTENFDQFWGQWSQDMTERERSTIQKYAGQVARYGGQLSGYYVNPTEANELARNYGIMTQPQAQAVQGMLAVAGNAGVSGDSIISYNLAQQTPFGSASGPFANAFSGTSGQASSVTMGDMIAQMAQRYTPARMGFITQASNVLVDAGVNALSAFGLGENFQNNVQISQAAGAIQQAQQFGYTGATAAYNVAQASYNMPAWKNQIGSNISQLAYMAGYGPSTSVGIMASIGGMGTTEAYQAGRVAQGDLGTMSYLANQGQLPAQYLSQNLAGRPIYETNMGGFMSFMRANQGALAAANIPLMGNLGNGSTQSMSFNGSMPMLSGINPNPIALPLAEQLSAYLGNTDMEAMNTLAQGGTQAYAALHAQRQAGFSLASAGNALATIAENQRYMWGGGKGGGTWDNPTAGSAWGLENTQRAMQYSQQMADFSASSQRMQTQNQFAMQSEALQYQRMSISQGYQRFQMGFEQTGAQLQRGWTQEDWQYQDQSRSMNFGWQMEDYEQAIRFSKGRERKNLVKQRDRAVTSQNMEEEQVDKQRTRQEQLWAREDERMEKQRSYTESMMKIDQENFDLQREQRETFYKMDEENLSRQKSDYLANYALQTQTINAQREHQKIMLDLQKQSAGIQAAAAAEQIQYAKDMEKITTDYTNATGTLKTTMENIPTEPIEALQHLIGKLDTLRESKMDAVANAVDSIDDVNTAGLSSAVTWIQKFVNTINNVNSAKIQSIIRLLTYMD